MLSNPFSRRTPSSGADGDRQQQQILLGWNASDSPQPFGIRPGTAASPRGANPVTYDGDAPVLTVASTGSGKGRGVLIPNLLRYPGPVIVVDIKGELYQVAGRRRREMGQQVKVLDPFGLVTARSDGLNPLDLLTLPRADVDSDAEMLASLLAVGHQFSREPFWDTTAKGLLAGLIAHIANGAPGERHLGGLARLALPSRHGLRDRSGTRPERDQEPHGTRPLSRLSGSAARADAAVHTHNGVQLHQRLGQPASGGVLARLDFPVDGCVRRKAA